jgi:hypothetical protein
MKKGRRKMSKKWLFVAIFMGILLIPAMAIGATQTGTIQGFNCVTQGKLCPVGKEDPMAAAEKVFVLWNEKDKKFYFIPNVDRAVLARHLAEMVRVEGNMSDKYNAIYAQEIYAQEGKKWRKVWTLDWQDEIYKDVLGAHPLKGKR